MVLEKSVNVVLKQCMGLKERESCLIVTDKDLKNVGEILFRNSLKISKRAKLMFTPIPDAHGAEPPKEIADEMKKYDVVLLATTKSLTHTRARKSASKKGARIASMPGIAADMMGRALNVDFHKVRKLNNKLISILKKKTKIRITTKKGTDVEFYVKNRKWLSDDGKKKKKGSVGNLPAGEIFIAPLENRTNGNLVVDASVGGLGKVDKDVAIKIKDGFIQSVAGGKIAREFKNILRKRLYGNVAELGIGTNPKAKITGEVLEDEKVMGTCHIAFGNNKHFGGKIDVPFHVDVVIKNPTIYADNKLVMKDGSLKF